MTPAVTLLKKNRIAFNLHSYQHDPTVNSYGLEAAEKLQVEVARVFKTLLVKVDKEELLVAVLPVAHQLSLKAIAQAAGVKKAQLADPKEAERVTGYLVGGISPIGQKKALRTFIDQSATTLPSLFISGGRRGLDLELAAADLQQITRAQFFPLIDPGARQAPSFRAGKDSADGVAVLSS